MRQKDHLTILVCGEEGVGKTSLIATYITQTFPTPSSLPKLMPDVQIPAAESEDECETTLVDSPELGGEGSLARQQLALALGGADAILLLYDAGREETFERLETHWLPFIAKEAHVSHQREMRRFIQLRSLTL
jgi:Ras family protein T1